MGLETVLGVFATIISIKKYTLRSVPQHEEDGYDTNQSVLKQGSARLARVA